MKFLTDEMHGDITTWLRLLGYDTKYAKDFEKMYGSPVRDDDLITEAQKEKRIIITNDEGMSKKIPENEVMLLNSNNFEENMIKIFNKFHIELKYNGDKSRCTKCNAELNEIQDKDKLKDEIPERILETQEKIWKCTNNECKKNYWVGGHFKNILKKLDELKNLTEENLE